VTTTDCFVTLAGLDSHTDPANPGPFRDALPAARSGHYWAPALEAFAREHGLALRYPLDNLTVEVAVTGAELQALLIDGYGADDPFLAHVAPYLSSTLRYLVYAEDF